MKRLILLLLFFVTCSVASYGQITFSSLTEISDGSVDTSAQIVLVNPTSNIPVWRGSVGELLKAISRVGEVIATGSIIDGTITDADIASGADIGIEKLDTTSADGVVSKSRLSNALDDVGSGVLDTLEFFPSATVSEINSALSHPGTVILRGGTFNLSSGPILITSDNVNLIIEGDATIYSPSGAVVDTFENNQIGDPDITFMITTDGNDNVSIIHRGVIDCVAARSPIILKDGKNLSYIQEGGSWTAADSSAYDLACIWAVDVEGLYIPKLIYNRPDILGASTQTSLAPLTMEGVIGGYVGYLEVDRVDETIDVNFYCTDIHFGTIISRRPVGSAELIDMTDLIRSTFDYIYIDASEGDVQKDYAIHIKTDGDQEDATADDGSSRLTQNLIPKNLRSSRELTFKKVHIKGGDDFDNSIIRLFTNSDLNEFNDIVFENLYVDSLSTSLLSDNANAVTLDRFKINATIDLLTGSSTLLDLNDYSGINNRHDITIRDASGWTGSYVIDTKLGESDYRLRIDDFPTAGTLIRTRTNGKNNIDLLTQLPFADVAIELVSNANIVNLQSHTNDTLLINAAQCNQVSGRINFAKAESGTLVYDNSFAGQLFDFENFFTTSESTIFRNVINGVAISNGDALLDSRWAATAQKCGIVNQIEQIIDVSDSTLFVPDRLGNWYSISTTGVANSDTLILDLYPSAELAYSVNRKLRTNYSGNCIEVRRSSDDNVADIDFVNGVLDTASLKTFCGANNCFVRTIYDQSGNGNDAVQTTNTSQAQIVSSGTILRVNGQPAIDFDGTDDWYSLTSEVTHLDPYSAFAVSKRDLTSTYMLIMSNDTVAGAPFFGILADDNNIYVRWDLTTLKTVYDNTDQILTSYFTTASSGEIFSNGSSLVSGTGGGGATIGFNSVGTRGLTGDPAGADYGDFKLQELIFYEANQSSNRTGIETNINAFYSIF
jgi:hypothetical protein